MDVQKIRNILSKFSKSTIRKRKREIVLANPLVQYVTALVQPHIIAQTQCAIPFEIISKFDDHTIYMVEGNPPIKNLIVFHANDIPTHFEFD